MVEEVNQGHLVRLLPQDEDEGCEELEQFVKIYAVIDENHFVRGRLMICVTIKWLAC